MADCVRLCIVVPCYNEQEVLPETIRRLADKLESLLARGAVTPTSRVLFVNDEKLLHFSYKRYLENVIRGAFDFSGTPIRIQVRNKKEEN